MSAVVRSGLSRWAGVFAGLAAAAVIGSPAPAVAQAPLQLPIQPPAAVPVPPELDAAFYRPPAEVVAATVPGELIAVRQVNLATVGIFPLNVDAWQVSYRSNDSRDQPIPAVATLIKPRGTSASPRKLLSMQMAEDSTSTNCAPSYALTHNSVATLLGQAVVPAEFLFAQAALAQGWAVVVPDHQGPNSAYAAGPLGARITLDGIRAATGFAPLGVGPSAPVALYGYSGGSMPTGHAAELHATYAPELNIVGAAAGGVGADLGDAVDMANGQATSGLVLAAIIGLSREYPDFATLLDRNLDPFGRALVDAKSPLCIGYTSALLPFVDIKGMIRVAGDPMRDPAVQHVIDDTRLGKRIPDMPMFIWQSTWDWILPLGATDRLVQTYCQDPSARVRYTRDHASEHVIAEVVGGPAALLWLGDRLNGVPVASGCTTEDVASMIGTPGELDAIGSMLGETIAGLFGKPIGAR